MSGFLRLVGALNAAVWLGAIVFLILSALPAAHSAEMENLLGARNYPYFSGAIAQMLQSRCFHLQLICGFIALAHYAGDRLYFGKSSHRLSLALLLALLALALFGGTIIQPRLKRLHTVEHAVNTSAEAKRAAAESAHAWTSVGRITDLLTIVGLSFYVVRLATPTERRAI